MTSPFSCSAASSGLPRLFHMSKPSSKWGPSSPGQELLCVSRRKFANLDLLRIRHFEKFDFRSDTHGTGLILGKYQTGNRAIWLVDFLYQPSQELSRVITAANARSQPITPVWRTNFEMERFSSVYWWGNPGNLLKKQYQKAPRSRRVLLRVLFCFVSRLLSLWEEIFEG